MGFSENSSTIKREWGREILSLSLLLFVMNANFLQSVLNEAMRNNIMCAPLQVNSCPDFPIIQYADDAILALPAEDMQLLQVKTSFSILLLKLDLKSTITSLW